ncbi:MAG: hypothetical protein CSYNP_01151 [Syntrophus sp. SKADARSKE-3]|nr:hypothetical protein [Syntrophus sp. SKADARSKE-3]
MMNCPNSRASWVLSIGGLNIRIVSDQTASDIILNLKKLFVGFDLADSAHADGQLFVSFDVDTIYQEKFDANLNDLTKTAHVLASSLFDRIKFHDPTSVSGNNNTIHTYQIGFLNGLLIYPCHSAAANCLLFRSGEDDRFLVGSLHKLLFIFLCIFMAERGCLFVHGAAIRNHQEGYIFWGASGAGKTTVAGLSDREDVLSDDAPVLMRRDETFFCAPSPFCQLEPYGGGLSQNLPPIPMKMNIFLQQAQDLDLARKMMPDALSEIISSHIHGFELMDNTLKKKVFHFIYDFCTQLPAYDLRFTKDNRFWKLISDEDLAGCSKMSRCKARKS